jgi:hypothetical protein
MKKKSLLLLMMFALCRAATAADPATPGVGLEPQPVGQSASGATPGSPPGAGLDDFGFAHSSAQPSGPADPAARDDEYRSAAQPMPALEGF